MASSQAVVNALQQLQTRFCLIDLGGEVRVIDRIALDAILSGATHGEPCFYKRQEAQLLIARFLENLPYPCIPKDVIRDFFVSPTTIVYSGTAFDPLHSSANALNFWVPPIHPDPSGNPQIILDFLLQVICDCDNSSFTYLIGYLAHMFQKPSEKPGVMIVLLGGQGTGKGMFFRLLRAIWPRTTLQVSDIAQVTERFNASLEKHYLVCMDEALFAGDRKALDRLKSLVTEPVISVEQKHQPSRLIVSVHRFFAASNHDHFVHVELDDRRFVFLRVSNCHQQDTGYFSSLASALDDRSIVAGFAHYLASTNLSVFDVRKKPNSNEHLSQKLKSLQGPDRWWEEVLRAGEFSPGSFGIPQLLNWVDSMFLPTNDLVAYYKSHSPGAQRHQSIRSTEVITAIQKYCPSAKPARQLCSSASFTTKTQKRGLLLPDLATARGEFEKKIGGKVPWD